MHIHRCHRYHMYTLPPIQYNHLHNMCTSSHVHKTTFKTCTQRDIYTAPLHNMYAIPHIQNIMCTTPHVHSFTCTTCTQHHMHIEPYVQHVKDTTCSQYHLYNHAKNTICTTRIKHHMYIEPYVQHA